MYKRRFPWLRDNGSACVLTAFDAQGKKYTADMHGLTADPKNPGGRMIPSIASVTRYDPYGRLESSTGYSLQGPSYWSTRDPNGVKNIEVTGIGVGLDINFCDAQGRPYKEWLVNKRGQVYQEQIRQARQWTMMHDLQDLKTPAEVPWGEALRESMEYYPGRARP
jgi:hypothetical protein